MWQEILGKTGVAAKRNTGSLVPGIRNCYWWLGDCSEGASGNHSGNCQYVALWFLLPLTNIIMQSEICQSANSCVWLLRQLSGRCPQWSISAYGSVYLICWGSDEESQLVLEDSIFLLVQYHVGTTNLLKKLCRSYLNDKIASRFTIKTSWAGTNPWTMCIRIAQLCSS